MSARGFGCLVRTWKNAYPPVTAPVILRRAVQERVGVGTRAHDFRKSDDLRRMHLIAHYQKVINRQSPHRRKLSTANDTDVYGEEWPEHEFSHIAEASLEFISDKVADVGFTSKNAPEDFDIEFSQGVLTISLGSSGTYVLNTQTPNRQIWMSSPSSGPWRYAWNPQQRAWVSTRDGHTLNDRLTEELTDVFKESVLISFKDVSVA